MSNKGKHRNLSCRDFKAALALLQGRFKHGELISVTRIQRYFDCDMKTANQILALGRVEGVFAPTSNGKAFAMADDASRECYKALNVQMTKLMVNDISRKHRELGS